MTVKIQKKCHYNGVAGMLKTEWILLVDPTEPATIFKLKKAARRFL